MDDTAACAYETVLFPGTPTDPPRWSQPELDALRERLSTISAWEQERLFTDGIVAR